MNYYNEIDPYAAAWLRQLIADGLIPPGHVDQRSICDVQPKDLDGYTQCHFFAGIGGWSLALQLVGWPADRPIWSGSCPCQSFSSGNQFAEGLEDARHLWPDFFRLIKVHRPDKVVGEQVPRAINFGWLDIVGNDFESEDYAFGSIVLRASGFKAVHDRPRIFWVGDSMLQGSSGCEQERAIPRRVPSQVAIDGNPLADAKAALAGHPMGLWVDDGVPRKLVEVLLKGYGNAIVPQVAAEFIKAIM